MSNEPEKLVTETVEATKREFVIGILKGDKTDEAYGVRGYPSSYLIDADGRVVWAGNGPGFDEKLLEELLADVILPPPAKFKDLVKLHAQEKYGKLWESAAKAAAAGDKELEALKVALESVLTRRLARAKTLAEAGDVALAAAHYERLAAQFAGLPEVATAKSERDRLEKNPSTKDEFLAQNLFERAESQLLDGDEEKAVGTWQSVVKKYKSTAVAKRAQSALERHGVH